jgi:hypothetical protein
MDNVLKLNNCMKSVLVYPKSEVGSTEKYDTFEQYEPSRNWSYLVFVVFCIVIPCDNFNMATTLTECIQEEQLSVIQFLSCEGMTIIQLSCAEH